MLKLFKNNRIPRTGLILLVLLSFLLVTTGLVYSHPFYSKANAGKGQYFVDKNKDGICDNCGQRVGMKSQFRKGKGYGPGDGTGNFGLRPKDGTGYGARYDCPLRVRK
jgi:hypothetical protein